MASFVPLLFVLLELPSWLVPPAGVNPQQQQMEGLSTLTYLVKEKPETAVEHFRPIFAERKLPFQPGADGIGVTVRAAAPECDLLMQFHPASGGETRVTVNCAERRTYSAQPVVGTERMVSRIERPMRRSSTSSRRQGRMTEIEQPAQKGPLSIYVDNAPPLVWPAWFHAYGTKQSIDPQPGKINAEKRLIYRYETKQRMRDMRQHYEQLFKVNGFIILESEIATGNTLNGSVQNADAHVWATQNAGPGVNSPYTAVRAGLQRRILHGPVLTSLSVCVQGSLRVNR